MSFWVEILLDFPSLRFTVSDLKHLSVLSLSNPIILLTYAYRSSDAQNGILSFCVWSFIESVRYCYTTPYVVLNLLYVLCIRTRKVCLLPLTFLKLVIQDFLHSPGIKFL